MKSDGMMTVAARFRDGSVEFHQRLAEGVMTYFRRLDIFRGDERLVRAYFNRGYSQTISSMPVVAPMGFFLIDFLTKTVLQLSDFPPIDREELVHLASGYRTDTNKGAVDNALDFAAEHRVRQIVRTRRLTSPFPQYSRPGPWLSMRGFVDLLEAEESLAQSKVEDGRVITNMVVYDISPFTLETRGWTHDRDALKWLNGRLRELVLPNPALPTLRTLVG